ncbi:group I truncated hemoglobin [Tahibacter harae]|uniref:Group 1 truncated hemoglobin n=1 Tax=Tahibacter harae TaxID=2963937 RepID=A0ABT1QZA6_9GAMM|nr:group 1 truncated hemoglobin [Tahibacter harae]MCQ4167624.1 group 1 truncated hemoglobin [Tahibacter harae]
MKTLLPSLLAVLLTACAATPQKPAVDKNSLYQRLGGMPAIETVVDASIRHIHGDLRINIFFENTDIPDLRRLLVEQICAAAGGPCTYTGRSMEEAHSGMNLTDKDFDIFVEDLIAAMNEVQVPAPLQQELLALFGPMRPQVVGQ